MAKVTGIRWQMPLALVPTASVPKLAAIAWTLPLDLTTVAQIAGEPVARVRWTLPLHLLPITSGLPDSSPLLPDGPGVPGGAVTRGGTKLRLTLYQPSSVRRRRDVDIATVDIDKPPRNEPIIFRPTAASLDYMAPIFLDVRLRSGKASGLGSAILTLRWQKRREES